jgi:hypothetical protein
MPAMAKQKLEPTYIKQRLEKARYKTGGKIGVRVARVRAEGGTRTEEGVETTHALHLEMEQVDGVWRPVPPVGDDFTSAPSILKSESNGCFTRAYIRNLDDLQRILIRLGAITAPVEATTPTKRGWRPRRPAHHATPAKPTETAAKRKTKQPAAGKRDRKPVATKKAPTTKKPARTAAKKPTRAAAAAKTKRGAKPVRRTRGK